jgi:hypothetical protein
MGDTYTRRRSQRRQAAQRRELKSKLAFFGGELLVRQFAPTNLGLWNVFI